MSGNRPSMRRIRYQEIADVLRARVTTATPGSVLASEAELSSEFQASRVTVRKALDVLRDEGRIDSRQGFGWFVATEPVRQRLEQLGTIESEVEGVGKLSERRIEEFAFVDAPGHVADVLRVPQVLRVKRVNLADGEPFAVVTVWCPAELGSTLSRRSVERRPFYELLDLDLRGATQTIAADLVDPGDAALLGVPAASPVLRCERVTTDTSGDPVLLSEHVFPAHRTEFVVDLPQAEPSMTPSGLRLVE
ncbi:MAG: GntR family transcriptional regulator [Actinomycetota bacterium]